MLTLMMGIWCMPQIGVAAAIIIDPGHGGNDPGAIGINGLYEKKVNLDISLKLREELTQLGYEVVMTRESDRTISLAERVELARNVNADLFVSIHANAHPSAAVRGTMVLYYNHRKPNPEYPASHEMIELSPESQQFAQTVLTTILQEIPNKNRGLLSSSAYVVRNGNIPSILVEVAYLSNRKDAALLKNSQMRSKYAKAIAQGIYQYKPPTFNDLGKHWAAKSIMRLHKLGIAGGYAGRFYPDQYLTRAEMAVFLQRSLGLQPLLPEPIDDTTKEVSFADLPSDHWAYYTMLQATRTGLLLGYPDETIRPDDPVTRAEVAAVLFRYIDQLGEDSTNFTVSPFQDVLNGDWAYAAIVRLTEAGIIRGLTPERFGPSQFISRAQWMVMLDRHLTMKQLTPVVMNPEPQ
jgi:N-acetylmuramoyl-L-alanine amidase